MIHSLDLYSDRAIIYDLNVTNISADQLNVANANFHSLNTSVIKSEDGIVDSLQQYHPAF